MAMLRKNSRACWLFGLLIAVMIGSFALAAEVKPSRTSTYGSHEQLRGASPLSQNFVIDQPKVWYPVSGGSQVSVASLVGLGTGTPAIAEINTSEINGFTLDADNESVSWLVPIPVGIDLSKDIVWRCLGSNSESAGTGTMKLLLKYGVMTADTTALAVAATTTGVTNGDAQADLAANVLDWSNTMTIAGGTFSGTPGDDFWVIMVYADVTTIANWTLYGCQMSYYSKWINSSGGGF